MAVNARDYAVVVGIDDYPNYRPLDGATRDAQAFALWLTDADAGGGLPAAHCKVVLSSANPVRPVQDDIDDALAAILDAARGGEARRFYFYFSGHGLAQSQTSNFLCLAAFSESRNILLDAHDYLDTIAATGLFQEIVFLTDCCRARVLAARGLPCTIATPLARNRPGTRIFLAYAAEVFTQAFEEPDEQGRKHGNFTRVLLEGLRGAAASAGQAGVAPPELKQYLELYVKKVSNGKQAPEILDGLDGNTRFGSATLRTPTVAVRIGFHTGLDGEIVLLDHNLEELKRGPAGTGWEMDLEPGPYQLQLDGTAQRMLFAVNPGTEKTYVEF